jgi:hypothetical protein
MFALTASSAQAGGAAPTSFPFRKSVVTLDLSDPEAGSRFQALIRRAQRHSLLYVDWTVTGPNRSELFGAVPGGSDPGSCEGVDVDRSKPITYSGRPDPGDNFYRVSIRIPASDDGLLSITCEQLSSTQSELRLRGFFHLYTGRVATASEVRMTATRVEPALIPPGFLR